jgi:heat shock protein 4
VPRVVGFVDVGDSKTSVFFASVWGNRAEVLFEKNLLSVGARNFDMNMMQLYLDKFEEKYGLDEHRDSPQVRIRLLNNIQKQRKILSANTEGLINIECLFEDYDFAYTMTRTEFETLNEPHLNQIRELLISAVSESQVNLADLHSVEIIGGGSRTPIIQRMIQEIMKKNPSKTLDASESIARGCAIKSAIVSPLFRVADYDIRDRSHYAFKAGVKYQSEKEETLKTVFQKGSHFNHIVSLTINRNEEVSIRLFYEDCYENNNLVLISSACLPPSKPQSPDHKSKLFFELDNNGLAQILKFEIKEKLNGQDEFKSRLIPFTKMEFLKSGKVEMYQMKEVENQTRLQINEVKLTQKAKYDLESFIYETRKQLVDSANKHFITSQDAEHIEKTCIEKEDWLYNGGEGARKGDYLKQREELVSISACIRSRQNTFKKINGFVEGAWKKLSSVQDQYKTALGLLSVEQRHKVEAARNQGLQLVGEMNVVKNNPSPFNLDDYDFEKKSSCIERLYQEMVDVLGVVQRLDGEEGKGVDGQIEEEQLNGGDVGDRRDTQ